MPIFTVATKFLDAKGVKYSLAQYEYDASAANIGLFAAEKLGASPDSVFKTLMLLLDKKPACAVLPSSKAMNLDKIAEALSGKKAKLMPPKEAEALTGLKVGGISPLGLGKKCEAIVLDQSAMNFDRIFVNGGDRGLQIVIAPEDLAKALGAVIVDISAADISA